jgi:hypothetical protein
VWNGFKHEIGSKSSNHVMNLLYTYFLAYCPSWVLDLEIFMDNAGRVMSLIVTTLMLCKQQQTNASIFLVFWQILQMLIDSDQSKPHT